MFRFKVREVKAGMRFADKNYCNQEGRSVRTLNVIRVREGGNGLYESQHPQIVYVECGVQWANGSVSRCWIALHRLLTSDYKLLPDGVKFECDIDKVAANG